MRQLHLILVLPEELNLLIVHEANKVELLNKLADLPEQLTDIEVVLIAILLLGRRAQSIFYFKLKRLGELLVDFVDLLSTLKLHHLSKVLIYQVKLNIQNSSPR